MGRRLGQHFLRAASVERLVQLIDPRPDDVFLEIGPGAGALTLPLAARAREVVAVELDDALAERLANRAPNVRVVHGDALRVDLASLVPPGSRLAGNLPYAISSPLLRRFLELRAHFRDMHVMLQKEVARRIAAAPGSKDYGILSVLYAVWTETDVPLQFGAREFDPPPKVDSAVLRGRFLESPRVEIRDTDQFETLLHRAFAQRRKTLENNLRRHYSNVAHCLQAAGIAAGRRAETISIDEFASLLRSLH